MSGGQASSDRKGRRGCMTSFSWELVEVQCRFTLYSGTHSNTVMRGFLSWLMSVATVRPLRLLVWGGRDTSATIWVILVSEEADIRAGTTP